MPLNWPERAPSRIYIIRISLVAKFVFVPLAPCSMGCFLGHFWGPLGQIWGHPASPNLFKILDLDLPQPVPPSFHAVPTVWDHQNLQIAILVNLGCFWALEVPNFKNIESGKWNEARGTLRVENMCPLTPTAKNP